MYFHQPHLNDKCHSQKIIEISYSSTKLRFGDGTKRIEGLRAEESRREAVIEGVNNWGIHVTPDLRRCDFTSNFWIRRILNLRIL